MLIDMHTHAHHEWTKESVEKCFKITNADFILLAATAPQYEGYWVSDTNEACLKIQEFFPEKVASLIGIHPPDVEQSLKDIDYYHKKGFIGVKLMTTVGYYPDDEKYRKVFEEVNARKMIVLSHCGWAGSLKWRDPNRSDLPQCTLCSHPYHLEPLIRIFDDTDFIMAHGGGRTMFQAAFDLVNYHENAWIDTCPGQGTWVLQHAGKWLGFLKWKQLLFGTDTCYGNAEWAPYFKETLSYVKGSIRLNGYEDEIENVLCNNAVRLLAKHGIKI